MLKTTRRNDPHLSRSRARPEAGAMPQNSPMGIVSGATYLVGLFFLSVECHSFALRAEQREDAFVRRHKNIRFRFRSGVMCYVLLCCCVAVLVH